MLEPITVHIHLTAKPGRAAALCGFLERSLAGVRQADGRHGARLIVDAEQEDRLLLVEQWSSVQRHEAHVARLVEAGLMNEVMALATEAPRSEYFAITGPSV